MSRCAPGNSFVGQPSKEQIVGASVSVDYLKTIECKICTTLMLMHKEKKTQFPRYNTMEMSFITSLIVPKTIKGHQMLDYF